MTAEFPREGLVRLLAAVDAPDLPDEVVEAVRAEVDRHILGGSNFAQDTRQVVIDAAMAALRLLALDRDAIARAVAAWSLDFAGLGNPIFLNDETPGDPHGPWDYPTLPARRLADAVIAASPLRSVAEVEAAALKTHIALLRPDYPDAVRMLEIRADRIKGGQP